MDRLTAVYERDGDWWVASVEEIPGANTQGASLEEARANLADAVRMVIDANREIARARAVGHDVVREELVLASA